MLGAAGSDTVLNVGGRLSLPAARSAGLSSLDAGRAARRPYHCTSAITAMPYVKTDSQCDRVTVLDAGEYAEGCELIHERPATRSTSAPSPACGIITASVDMANSWLLDLTAARAGRRRRPCPAERLASRIPVKALDAADANRPRRAAPVHAPPALFTLFRSARRTTTFADGMLACSSGISSRTRRPRNPVTIVIFGGGGDLAPRKLLARVYQTNPPRRPAARPTSRVLRRRAPAAYRRRLPEFANDWIPKVLVRRPIYERLPAFAASALCGDRGASTARAALLRSGAPLHHRARNAT